MLTLKVKTTSRLLARALPPSGPRLLNPRSSSVMFVFVCVQKCMNNNDLTLAVIESDNDGSTE